MSFRRLNISKENKVFGALEICQCASICIFMGYIVIYFSNIGLTGMQIGYIMSSTLLITMVSQMVTGYLCDYVITVKKLYRIYGFVTIVCVSAIPLVSQYYALVFLFFTLFSVTGRLMSGMLDAYVAKLAKKRSGLDFGFVRGLGSFGYAVMAICSGLLIKWFGYGVIFVFHFLLMVSCMLFLKNAEDIPLNIKTNENSKQDEEQKESSQKESFASAMKTIFRVKGFLFATLGTTISFVGLNMVSTYTPLVVSNIGGSSTDVGMALFLMAMSEVPIMWNYRRLENRFGERKLVMFSFVMYLVKFALVPFFFTVQGVVTIQLLQSISYGLYVPAMMQFMSNLLPKRFMATGIMVWSAISSGLSGTLASLLGGYIIEYYGELMIYYFSTVMAVVGLVFIGATMIQTKHAPKGHL